LTTLVIVIVCLTGGVSAVAGTVVWMAILLVRRLRGRPAAVKFHDLRLVWGYSAFLGIPVLFPWMPDFILESGEALLPYLYFLAIVLLSASASIAIGTVVSLSTVALARRAGFLKSPRIRVWEGGWQLRLVWLLSALVGVPLLAGRTATVVQALAFGLGPP
jgi:hypothetical protein